MKQYFIIGTDTDCGKTYVTCKQLTQSNRTVAIKPIESGGTSDTDLIKQHQPHYTKPLSLYSFTPPISPHLAAKAAETNITFEALDDFCNPKHFSDYETLLVETTGGVMCPINENQTWLDYLVHANASVIFVVGLRLGCLNHAGLTAHALQTNNIPCVGWIANICDPNMLYLQENIETLKQKLPYQHLETIPFKSMGSGSIDLF